MLPHYGGWIDTPSVSRPASVCDLLGMTRVDIDRLFKRCTVYAVDGSRKVYVSSGEVMGTIRAFPPGSIRRTWESHAA